MLLAHLAIIDYAPISPKHSFDAICHNPRSEHCTALAVQTTICIDYSRAAVMHNPPEASAPWCLVVRGYGVGCVAVSRHEKVFWTEIGDSLHDSKVS